MKTALILLEIQNDYFPNGRIPLERSLEASMNAQRILQNYRDNKLPIVHVQHISTNPNATALLPCTNGAAFHPSVQPLKGETVIKKHYTNCFKDTPLLNYLTKNHVRHLALCGMMTHLTIDAAVRAAYDFGFTCTVLHDACATHQLEFGQHIINAQHVQYAFMAAFGPIYAHVLSADDYLQKANPAVAAIA